MSSQTGDPIYVQYGCGFSPGAGWINFDSSPTLRLERLPVIGPIVSSQMSGNAKRFPASVQYGDICKGLPLPDDCAAGIYASHVLEHLSLREFQRALANTYKVLAPGGVFRLIVPDLLGRARRYVSDAESSPDAAFVFLQTTLLGKEQRANSPLSLLREMIGGSFHLWMWDFASLSDQLKKAGFVSVRKCEFGDSPDAMFSRVEALDRFIDPELDLHECAVEARKPI